nr:unnamed protein product [Callosobruchus analis]
MHFCTISVGHRHGNSPDFAHIRALNSRGGRGASVSVIQRGAHILFYCRVSRTTLPLRKTAGKTVENPREVTSRLKVRFKDFIFQQISFHKCDYWSILYFTGVR